MEALSLDDKKYNLDRQRLEIERQRLVLEGSFAKKYAAPIFSAVVAIVAGLFALAQVWVASISKDKELETTRMHNERRWKLDIADFVFKNREVIFSKNIEEQRRLRDVMLVTFPPEVATGLFGRIETAVPSDKKQLWQDGQVLALQIAEAEAIRSKALTHFHQGKFDEAVTAYDKGLDSDPNNLQLLNWKGYSLFRARKFDDAIATLKKVVLLRPDHELANLNLTKALCAAGRPEEAEKTMRVAINLKPSIVKIALADGEFTRTCNSILHLLTR
jgi:tetratricopeptide (TPR) repeat protein